MKNNNVTVKKETGNKLTPEIYDLYAPAVYGKILSIVHKGPIAANLLSKVFADTYRQGKMPGASLQTPLLSLINQARERSYKTVKSLTIFRECCSGASIHSNDKEAK